MKKIVKTTIWGWYQTCPNVVTPNGSIESPCHQNVSGNYWREKIHHFKTQFVEYQKVQMKFKDCHRTTLKDEGVMLNQWTTWASIC
jgi:hypothetical protein